jgi:DNA-directed RNA polymerase subunit RPC12/RpoP
VVRELPTLYLKCRKCAKEFPTPIGVTEAGLKGVIISGLIHRCPHCGHEDQYNTHDYHLPEGLPDPAAAETKPLAADPKLENQAKKDAASEKLAGYGVVPPEERKPVG